MTKRVNKAHVLRNALDSTSNLTNEDRAAVREMVLNASLTRSTLLNKLIDSRRDIDLECGYPKQLTTQQYKLMYEREGIATRVVQLFPEESWNADPEVAEDEEVEDTEFETAFNSINEKFNLWACLAKVDELSGIGSFGLLLLGFDDGKDLKEPLEGISETGESNGTVEHDLLFVRAFDESLVNVKALEKDVRNPRFGQPILYTIKFQANTKTRLTDGETVEVTYQEQLVHWSRVIHIADNRKSSEVYGTPRLQTLFNRLYDLRKIVGGSAEMFWKGGFPGLSFEMDPNAKPLTTDEKDDLRDEVANYANGLQRYIRLQGIQVKSLNPQVADPGDHVEVQLNLIAIALGVPKRIFMGTEQAKLAADQDSKAWNKRIARRQNKYLTPYVVRPVVDRLIAAGTLPEPESYSVTWPDMDAPSEQSKADVLKAQVEAFAKYVAGNVDMLIPPQIFLDMFAHLDSDQVQVIMDAALERQSNMEADEEEEELERQAAQEEAEKQRRLNAGGQDKE